MIKTYVTIGLVSLVVIAAVIYGFNSSGSPFDTRARNFDAKRVTDLTSIKYSIESYYSTNSKLPDNLSDLKVDTTYSSSKDPETGKSYEYKVTGAKAYKLCTTFSFASKANDPSMYYGTADFKHPKGYYCFDEKIVNDYSYSTIKTKVSTILDGRIDAVTSNATKQQTNLANFPYGFFSTDTTELGLIDFAAEPVTVNIIFKKPEKLQSISNTFTNCTAVNCYIWSAVGMTSTKQVDLVTNTNANESVVSTASITSVEEFTWIKITATRNAGDKYVHWKKIKLAYK